MICERSAESTVLSCAGLSAKNAELWPGMGPGPVGPPVGPPLPAQASFWSAQHAARPGAGLVQSLGLWLGSTSSCVQSVLPAGSTVGFDTANPTTYVKTAWFTFPEGGVVRMLVRI